jgi:hypothetical protein
MPDVVGFSNNLALNRANINKYVPRTPGCYVLDRSSTGSFEVHYTGRADYDLEERLGSWLGTQYLYFKFLSLSDRKSAYEMECKVYHNLRPVDNRMHPDAPDNTNYTCPFCPKEHSAVYRQLFGL